MKCPKLVSLLSLGLFLSMISIADVNTAHAAPTVDLGPLNTYKTFPVQGLTFANITQLNPGWTPRTITIKIEPADNKSLYGIELWIAGTHYYLNGWSQPVTVPYQSSTLQMLFENAESRNIKTFWWFN